MNYWLFKSEPTVYSIDNFKRDKVTFWEGVRNYQARNLLRDKVQKGDMLFFYHSNAQPTAIAGVAEVVKSATPDPSAFDKSSRYYDEKSKLENPTWFGVTIKLRQIFVKPVTLQQIKANQNLQKMTLIQKGSRLSIQPVSEKEFQTILSLAQL